MSTLTLTAEDPRYKAAVAMFGEPWARKWILDRGMPWYERDDKAVDWMSLVQPGDTGPDYESYSASLSRWARGMLSGWKSMAETRPPAQAVDAYFTPRGQKSAGDSTAEIYFQHADNRPGDGNPYFGKGAARQAEQAQKAQKDNERKVHEVLADLFSGGE